MEDTNLLHRGDPGGFAFAQFEARRFSDEGGVAVRSSGGQQRVVFRLVGRCGWAINGKPAYAAGAISGAMGVYQRG